MTPLLFTHANTRREVIVTREHITLIQYSDAHKATHLVSTAGLVIPVSETVEVCKQMVYGATITSHVQGGQTNGT